MPPLLFASLSKTKAFSKVNLSSHGGSNSNSNNNSSSSNASSLAFPPTVIQFYSTKSINLSNLQIINHEQSLNEDFAPLNYQTATIGVGNGDLTTSNSNSRTSTSNSTTNDSAGDSQAKIGIWNCCISPQSIAPAILLSSACSPISPLQTDDASNDENYSNNRSLPTFVLTLNLHPHKLDQIHPIMHTMLSNILQYSRTMHADSDAQAHADTHKGKGNGNGNHMNMNMNGGTTTSAKLAHSQFGKAPLAEDNDISNAYDYNHNIEENNQQQEGNVPLLNIIICGILPNTTDDNEHDKDNNNNNISNNNGKHVTYKDKQALNLISYHLQKFASEISCTLCFVNDHGSSSSERELDKDGENRNDAGSEKEMSRKETTVDPFTQKGLNVAEFAMALKKVCDFVDELDDDEDDDGDTNQGVQGDDGEIDKGSHEETVGADGMPMQSDHEEDQHPHQQPSIYGPFDYDADLINSVLLRGAGCPGVWNANTDSLWVALPPSSGTATTTDTIATTTFDKKDQEKEKEINANATVNGNGNTAIGRDDQWLGKLAESVSAYVNVNAGSIGTGDKSIRSSMDQTTRTSSQNTVATKKKVARKKPTVPGDKKGDSQDVQDFFAGLLNK
jgi:hypothetical protein